MNKKTKTIKRCVVAMLGASLGQAQAIDFQQTLPLEHLQPMHTVDERFQSYNVEMLEVTGGKFWKPYAAVDTPSAPAALKASAPVGMKAELFTYRPPVDLNNPRLRTLAAALAPAYVRTSGTWANSTYFADTDAPTTQLPEGFRGLLTRHQWKGLVDFSKAVEAPIITSFATSAGTRNEHGLWTATQAERFVAYTESIGGHIAAAEFMNEPNLAAIGGAPAGYDAAGYARDLQVFKQFSRTSAPEMLILGPGSVGENDEGWSIAHSGLPMIDTASLLNATEPGVDVFSYHHYSASSQRCGPLAQTSRDAALSEAWLARTDVTLAFYQKLRDKHEPGKPIWLTETADAACGGNPWASTFLDTFRYLDQLGRLAVQGVQVVAHNTLVASDYGLLEENDFTPKPNYWGALLWRTFMGNIVLASAVERREGLHVYAHCMKDAPGGVAVMVINNDRVNQNQIKLPLATQRYTLTGQGDVSSKDVLLNGTLLKLGENDILPQLKGVSAEAGSLTFEPASITFLTASQANNKACH